MAASEDFDPANVAEAGRVLAESMKVFAEMLSVQTSALVASGEALKNARRYGYGVIAYRQDERFVALPANGSWTLTMDEENPTPSAVVPRGYLLDFGDEMRYHEGSFSSISDKIVARAQKVFALYPNGDVSTIKDRHSGESLGKHSETPQNEPQAPENGS